MIHSLESSFPKKLKDNIFNKHPEMIEYINNENWLDLENYCNNLNVRWGIIGALWSAIYNIHPEFLKELGFVPAGCFAYTNIETIMLPDNISYIGKNAFYKSSIKEIFIPKSVNTIDNRAFNNLDTKDPLSIQYDGIYLEWRHIKKASDWLNHKYDTSKHPTTLVCKDKQIEIQGD